ncbi:MAG: glycine--tRNA ligase subunit beta [Deltaproteobacteria bacterium]|nr:glycine--tRNA ligase subunit beta [Deltaproteobacteria bacterium]
MNSLLLEIGTEEIPAGYIEPALNSLSSILSEKLTGSRIEFGTVRIFGTPKRLAIEIADVAEKQESLITEITGPPARIGFDENGKPTIAAEKFAQKAGIPVEQLKLKKTKKGEYLSAEKKDSGLQTRILLKTILPESILSITFPKTMKWADLDVLFARPIQSIMALFGENMISFTLGGIKSGRYVFGHRFMHPGKIRINDPAEYINVLRTASVFVKIDERKAIIEKDIKETAAELGGSIFSDSELVDIVTNLVEYPAVVAGRFDTKFLELPDIVLITSMREHQKYFSVVDQNNNLMPCFIAVNNTKAKDMELVSKGHERVLRSRLEDAMFFYRADLESSFDVWIDKLKGVLFQARLGSVYEKVERVKNVAEFIADLLEVDADTKKDVSRAAQLCKADLVTQVVVEFPKLQGIMGRVYALEAGENENVAAAIEEHYKPAYSGGPLPESLAGSILGIAEKIDSICGCFCVNLLPTGASDPYALRRQGIGIIQIMLKNNFSFSLQKVIDQSLSLFQDKSTRPLQEISGKIVSFLTGRMTNILVEEGFSRDTISAIVSVSPDRVPDVLDRVRALEDLKKDPDFEPIAVAFKRVVNIIKKSAGLEADFGLGDVDQSLFQDECERSLYNALNQSASRINDYINKGIYDQALHEIALMRAPVDAFFDEVLVMSDDLKIRNNRLALLGKIAELFNNFADFSRIST